MCCFFYWLDNRLILNKINGEVLYKHIEEKISILVGGLSLSLGENAYRLVLAQEDSKYPLQSDRHFLENKIKLEQPFSVIEAAFIDSSSIKLRAKLHAPIH